MRRLVLFGAIAFVLSLSALAMGVSRAAADYCTFGGGGTETCVYFVASTGGSGDMPSNNSVTSIWNYWNTNKMWRPTPNNASIFWMNNSPNPNTVHDPFSCVNCNPLRKASSWGYDHAWCSNLEDHFVNPTKCQVYNWNVP